MHNEILADYINPIPSINSKEIDINSLDELLFSNKSLSEKILVSSWYCESLIGEREIRPLKFYFEEINQIKREIESSSQNDSVEASIKNYIKTIDYEKGTFPSYSIEYRKADCISSSSLFLSLSELLDSQLFNDCKLGYICPKDNSDGHVFVRKKLEKDYENIDFGDSYPDEFYYSKFKKLPETKPKEAILSFLLDNAGVNIIKKGKTKNYIASLALLDEAIKLTPSLFGIWHNKGVILQFLNRNEEAKKCLAISNYLKTDSKI
ncbi:MAG: hypothetical protein PWR30_454 [Candidatus Woesearchaeota archaeon]|nr:hypothetical protein [Candidatus Woesearchaeota archaeon]